MPAAERDQQTKISRRNNKGFGLGRLLRYRLLVPVLRSRHPPEYTARGVALGLAVALTPTIGVQMPVVFLMWIAVRRLRPDWDFNLLVALAWTWLTNVATMPPIYYVFLVTGRIMLGRWEKIRDFKTFSGRLSGTLDVEANWLETLWVYTYNLFEQFGVPMFVGSLPWAVLGGWLGYRWTLRLIWRVRKRRERRRSALAESQQEPGDPTARQPD